MSKTIKLLLLLIFTAMISCKKDPKIQEERQDKFTIDSTQIGSFLITHPEFKDLEPEIKSLYRKHQYQYVWYDSNGRNDFAEVLYNKASQLENEGIPVSLPYKEKFAELFAENKDKPNSENDLMISAMYFFYAKKVYAGIDPQQSKQLGWYLPREKVSYVNYLDALMKDDNLIKKDVKENISQYYNLRKGLQHYYEIQSKGGWGTIVLTDGVKSLKKGDNAEAVAALRKRLFLSGDLKEDTGSPEFDQTLVDGLHHYQTRQNLKKEDVAGTSLIKELNIPVEDRIKTIIVNMERCRWIAPDYAEADEYIAVNIPSFSMRYIRKGKIVLQSNVVVGKELDKTVVFSGKMSYIVFSPYWNIPKSIIEKEIKPGMAKDKNYLDKHNMEWNNGNVRQKPGKENSLGLVKFMFPNSNNIYLHDTPAKGLFNKNDRALSHGCVRVEKARELAIRILEDDKNWNPAKIDAAMNGSKEKNYTLKHKIPVYIAYFTAWADENGNVNFYEDVYKRDGHLAQMLYQQ